MKLSTIMAFLLLSVSLTPVTACGETVSFPLQLDYPFLKTLLIHSAFTDPNQTILISDPANDCQQISLSNPNVVSENHLLRIDAEVHLKGGILMGQGCLFSIEWDGYLVAHMKPVMNPDTWELSFDPVDFVLLDKDRRPEKGQLWDYFEAPVMERMRQTRIVVNDPIDQFKLFLLSVVPVAEQPRVNAMLATLRPGVIGTEPEAIKIEISVDIEAVPAAAKPPAPATLSPREIDDFIAVWETWDSFLVQTLMSLMDKPLTPEERETLLTILLDTRYRFIGELEANAPSASTDFVREQFVDVWKKLSPILKNHLSRQPSANSWGYLAFFTSSDALAALDKLGPLLNIEISRNGLIRLARMLSEDKNLTLQYNLQVNPDLRTLLGLGSPIDITGPAINEKLLEQEDMETEPETNIPPSSMNGRQLIVSKLYKALSPRICWAGKSGSKAGMKEMKQWLVTKDNVEAHLEKIKPILAAATREKLKKNSIPKSYHNMFQHAVYATAWQESCFRHFIIDNKKLTYIRSYSNTSIGIMQINERVWRGIYNIEHLRWDVTYNVAAGVDIMNLYFIKYVLPKLKSLKGKDLSGDDVPVCSLYAMYNAGPGEFSRYVKRRKTGKFTEIDKHFKEKYTWVKSRQWDKLHDCF